MQQQLSPSHSLAPRVQGRLRLSFVCDQDSQQTRMAMCEQHPPLQVIRAFPLRDGSTLVHLHNISGGILGGDVLDTTVEVGQRATVQLTTTSATRLYRRRPEMPDAVQTLRVHLQENGLLEYLPDQLIPFAGACYRQQTHIELAPGAGLFYWETITPGRVARGEVFDYDMLDMSLDIVALGRPIAIERVQLQPHCHSLSSLARLGPYTYFCSFYICRVGLEASRWLALEKELNILARDLSRPGEIIWGVSTLVAHGLIVRALSTQGRAISSGLLAFWQAAKRALYGRDALPPRKVY